MIRRSLLAAAAAAASIAVAGCGVSDPLANPEFPDNNTSATTAPAAAVKVGERYATAARSFTADTLRPNYDVQLQLAGEPLLGALRAAGRPKLAEIHALRAARARTTATVINTTATSVQADRVTLEILLEERAVETGAIADNETRNIAELARDGDAWHVTAFTAQP